MSFSFNCPTCRQVLQTSEPVPIGRSVKCPACNNVFIPPSMPVDSGPVRTAEPAAPSPRGREEEPFARSPAPRPRDDDAYSRPAPSPSSYGDYNERRPAPKKGNGPLLAIIGVTVLLLVVAVVVGGFIWPGFFKSSGPDYTDLFAYLPEKIDAVMGVDVKAVRARKGTMDLLEKLINKSETLSKEALEIIKDADQIISGNGLKSKEKILIIKSSSALAADKVSKAFNAIDKPETVSGKTIYTVEWEKEEAFLALPTDRIVVIAPAESKETFAKLLEGKGKLPAGLDRPVNDIRSATVWVAFTLQGDLKDQFKNAPIPQGGPFLALKDVMQAVKSATAFSVSVELSQGAKMQATLHCANSTDAAAVHKVFSGLKDALKLMLPGFTGNLPPDVKGAVDDITSSLDFRQSGASVTAFVQISEDSLSKLEKMDLPVGADGAGRDRPLAKVWKGTETRTGADTPLEIRIENDFGGCSKVNNKGRTMGNYKRHEHEIRLFFPDMEYEGMIAGATMSGKARTSDGKQDWNWSVKSK